MQRDDVKQAVRAKQITGTQANAIAKANNYEPFIPTKYLKANGYLSLRGKMSGAFKSEYDFQYEWKIDNARLNGGQKHVYFSSLAKLHGVGHTYATSVGAWDPGIGPIQVHSGDRPQQTFAQLHPTGHAPLLPARQSPYGHPPQQTFLQQRPNGYAPRQPAWQPPRNYAPQQAYGPMKPREPSSALGEAALSIGRGLFGLR